MSQGGNFSDVLSFAHKEAAVQRFAYISNKSFIILALQIRKLIHSHLAVTAIPCSLVSTSKEKSSILKNLVPRKPRQFPELVQSILFAVSKNKT